MFRMTDGFWVMAHNIEAFKLTDSWKVFIITVSGQRHFYEFPEKPDTQEKADLMFTDFMVLLSEFTQGTFSK